MRSAIIILLAGLALTGCQKRIGDSCGNSTDCSVTGERQCDLSQPGGYCTVFSCDPDTCPEGACVEWRFVPSRTAETWCMKTCNGEGDCGRAEYFCVEPAKITQSGGESMEELPLEERVARVIDLDIGRAQSKICVAVTVDETENEETENDGGMPDDGGM